LKVDKSFVHDLITDAADAGVVSAIIQMGRSLKMRVVAEGVESKDQVSVLRQMVCTERRATTSVAHEPGRPRGLDGPQDGGHDRMIA